MNDIVGYFLKSIISSTYSLKKKSVLVEKPWALVDKDTEIQKLIFKKDHGLILSKNGIVKEGRWEYYPEAKALLIDRGSDKLLLKEQFIDDNVLVLKKDGTNNEFFTLANENTIPDYNVLNYLNTIKCKHLKIHEFKLFNSNLLQIHEAKDLVSYSQYKGLQVELLDEQFNSHEPSDGRYLSKNKKLTFIVKKGKIVDVTQNIIKELLDGQSVEIEDGTETNRYYNINRNITLNGVLISKNRLIDKDNFIYEVKNGKILKILFVNDYELKDGRKIKIEQQDINGISKGDRIIPTLPEKDLPDGKHKIRGKLFKIKVYNNTVV